MRAVPRTLLTALCLALALASLACSSEPPPESTPAPPANSMQIGMASTDLAVGDNRVVFALIRPGVGIVKEAQVEVHTFHLSGDDPNARVQSVPARFSEWPTGGRGVYIANLRFDESGDWGLGAVATFADGSALESGARLSVKDAPSTPALGKPAPRTHTKTAAGARALADITTDLNPDPDLYRLSIADALDEAKPLLVSFATPAYCATATCGPQMDVIKSLKDSYAARANFIHVEVYDNLEDIRESGLDAARPVPALAEWGLPSEPWTFVVDANGLIRAKYEGFVNAEELTATLESVLPES